MAIPMRRMIEELRARTIAGRVHRPIEARAMDSPFDPEDLRTFATYRDSLGRHYCLVYGREVSEEEAQGRSVQIIEREYRDRGGDIVSAYHDAVEWTNGGIAAQRQMITDAVKRQAGEFYVMAVFDRYLDPTSWEERVEAVRAFIDECRADLVGLVDAEHPERHARDLRDLIRSYIASLERNAALFRRL